MSNNSYSILLDDKEISNKDSLICDMSYILQDNSLIEEKISNQKLPTEKRFIKYIHKIDLKFSNLNSKIK